ncbi:MAG: methyl-accepting chemotaxis protein [Dehalococcoidia bacterium]|jgi:methyl-accepting chemotaxis protein
MIQAKEKKGNGSAGHGLTGSIFGRGRSKNAQQRKNGKVAKSVYDLNFIDLIPVPVVFFDREFTIQFVNNPAAEVLTGAKESCLGQKCYDLFKFKFCNTPNCQACKAFADGNTYSSEVVVKSPKGDVFFRCYTIPVKDDSGEIIGAMEYFIDATRELTFGLEMGNLYGSIALGKPEARADYNKFDGLLRRHVKGTNMLLDSLLGLIMGQDQYFQKFAKGEKLERWKDQPESAHGCWKEMHSTFNDFIDSINNFMEEMQRLTRESAEGKLDTRGDASKFKGCWAEMMAGINSTLDSIIEPIDEVFRVLHMESQNDLTVKVTGDYKGDLSRLRDAVNESLNGRIDVMKTLKKVSNDLAGASAHLKQSAEQSREATEQIAASSQQVAKGASDQATSMQQTLSAVEKLVSAISQIAKGAQEQAEMIEKNVQVVNQVSQAINQVSASAKQTTTSSKDTSGAAQKGADMVQNTIKGMENIMKTMDSASEKVSGLGDRSREIGKIVATINDIADQTNLLALNAAIEAARAGEQGRGFAVVADEVRKLAERASASTKEIEELINNIQNGVQDTINAMTKGTEEVANGYELATRAGCSLDEILSKSKEMGKEVEQISSATQQLSNMSSEMVKLSDNISAIAEENTAITESMDETVKQVSKSVEEVAGVSEQNSASTEEVSAAAEQISAQSHEVVGSSTALQTMSGQFKELLSSYKLPESN